MRIKHLAQLMVCTLISLLICSPLAWPVETKSSALPGEVKAYLPAGATSFFASRLPLGFGGTNRFVHIWGAVRPNTPASLNSYNPYTYSPFCVDIFEPIQDEKNHWRWRFVCAASYAEVAGPTQVLTHWLRPSARQGPVLEIISSNGAPGLSTMHTLFVWDKGLHQSERPPSPQMFASGASGGGVVQQIVDGMDERGFLTVTTKNYYVGKLVSTVVRRWDGERFVASQIPK